MSIANVLLYAYENQEYLLVAVLIGLILFGSHLLYKNRWYLLKRPTLIFLGWIYLGTIFALWYFIVDNYWLERQSGFNAEFYKDIDPIEFVFNYLYFSFITMATVGYGDYSPLHPLVRMSVIVESAIGMVLVATYAGSVVYRLTYSTSKLYLASLIIWIDGKDKITFACSLDNYEVAVDKFDIDVFWMNRGNGMVCEYHSLPDMPTSSNNLTVVVPLEKHFTSHVNKYSKGLLLGYSVKSMSFNHSGFIRLQDDICTEIENELLARADPLLAAERKSWHIALQRSDSYNDPKLCFDK